MTPSMQKLFSHCEENGLDQHPFLKGLRGRPADLGAVHDIMSNAQAFQWSFVPWLAGIISRHEDRRIQSPLARQLNDELGNGNPSHVHSILYDRMVGSLTPWKRTLSPDVALAPGKALHEEAGRYFCAPNRWEALGAVMAGEIFAHQFETWLGGEFERHPEFDLKACGWFNVHEGVEVQHAKDSVTIGDFVPNSASEEEAVWRGAQGIERAFKSFLDNLQKRHLA